MGWKKNLAFTTALVGAATVGMHMINKWIYFSATLDGLLKTESEMYYEWRFGKIYYKKCGEGKPLLLIHDLTTCSSACEWSKVIDSLSENHTVYALDLLGCGRSDKPNLTYTNFLYVQMITDFIKHVIGESTDIIVTGTSSSLVLGACHTDKTIIDRIILVNPEDMYLAAKIPGKRSKLVAGLINLPIIGTLLYNTLNNRKEIESLFRTEYYCNGTKLDEGIMRTYYETAHLGDASSKYLFASLAGNYMTANVPLYLDSLDNSIFLLSGEKEKNTLKIEEQYKSQLPSIEAFEIADTKHLPQLENPKEFLEQIHILLDEE